MSPERESSMNIERESAVRQWTSVWNTRVTRGCSSWCRSTRPVPFDRSVTPRDGTSKRGPRRRPGKACEADGR